MPRSARADEQVRGCVASSHEGEQETNGRNDVAGQPDCGAGRVLGQPAREAHRVDYASKQRHAPGNRRYQRGQSTEKPRVDSKAEQQETDRHHHGGRQPHTEQELSLSRPGYAIKFDL